MFNISLKLLKYIRLMQKAKLDTHTKRATHSMGHEDSRNTEDRKEIVP
jgi:hypothetical protein